MGGLISMRAMATSRGQRIGILGGTFNPIHLGHLLIAQDALEQGRLERVKFIPTATPPHKVVPDLASAQHRWQMVRRAIRGNARFEADDIELERGGVSYSVETVRELQRRHPGVRFCLIIGADSLQELHMWREAAWLARECEFIVLARPGYPARSRLRLKSTLVNGHLCEIASREIRARVAGGKSIRYLVPGAVFRYIHAHQLYL